MLSYVNVPNIDTRVLRNAARILQEGGLVAYPTDTSWSISCALQSRTGIAALKALKGGSGFTPTVICAEIRQFDALTVIDTAVYRSIKPLLPGPFVFVFEARHAIQKVIAMKRPEIGLRIPDHPVPQALVREVGEPLFAITASRCMTEGGWWDQQFAEEHLFDYGGELEGLPGVELIIDSGEVLPKGLATVVTWTGGEPAVLRQGLGRFPV